MVIVDESGKYHFPGTVEADKIASAKKDSYDLFSKETGFEIRSYRHVSLLKLEDPDVTDRVICLINRVDTSISVNFRKVVDGKAIQFAELTTELAHKMESLNCKRTVSRAVQLAAAKGD